mgnify:CR=1 FL=1
MTRGGAELFFQAEDGIRDVERSRGLGDVYKRQAPSLVLIKRSGQKILSGQHTGHITVV